MYCVYTNVGTDTGPEFKYVSMVETHQTRPTQAALARRTSRWPINPICTFQVWSVNNPSMHRLVESYELLWEQR